MDCMIEDRRITVWQVDLDARCRHVPTHRSVLSFDELERANGFRSNVHRDWFIACRAALRRILGTRLGTPPERIRFRYGASGKPELASGSAAIRFNVTHTRGRALIAVGGPFDIGVDLERDAPVLDWSRPSALIFSEEEKRELAEAPDKSEAFLRGWTRKEAVLKALGVGLSGSPTDLTVSLSDEPSILSIVPEGGCRSDWTLIDIRATAGVAALAARVSGASVDLRTMDLV